MPERNVTERDQPANAPSHEGDGHSTSPQVQTPDKPSQAEGDRETIETSISEKESVRSNDTEGKQV